jgi:hypothetical protein
MKDVEESQCSQHSQQLASDQPQNTKHARIGGRVSRLRKVLRQGMCTFLCHFCEKIIGSDGKTLENATAATQKLQRWLCF